MVVPNHGLDVEHVPPQRCLGAGSAPFALLGTDPSVHQWCLIPLLLLVMPLGWHYGTHLCHVVGCRHDSQRTSHLALFAAGCQGLVHNAQSPTSARNLHRWFHGGALVRSHFHPALDVHTHQSRADGHHVYRDACRYCILDPRQSACAQGTAYCPPLLWDRSDHHASPSQIHHVCPSCEVHSGVHRARDCPSLYLPTTSQQGVLAVRHSAFSHGDRCRDCYWLHVSRTTPQCALPAGPASRS
mmetsp:Transcript_30631/g.93720  ORF Transcript_30631/g.93720 Transcript_30631/m.93720 type:complete len:242 (-) Transcript_30631:974-1699(-)